MDKINLYHLYYIKKIQRQFRELKRLRFSINKNFTDLKEIILKMLINLTSLQQKKVFIETPGHYNLVLDKIKVQVLKMKSIPNLLKFKDNLYEIKRQQEEISKNIVECMNHICPKKFSDTMKFITDDNYFMYNFKQEELDFLDKMFNCIMVWDSDHHKSPIDIKLEENPFINNTVEKESNLLASLLSGQNNNPNKISNLIENITKAKKHSDKNSYRKNHFLSLNVITKFNDFNKIVFGKNNSGSSLLEELSGINLYIKYNSKYLVIQGYIQDDILGLMKEHSLIKNKLIEIKKHINYNKITIPTYFRNNFLEILSIKDILLLKPEQVSNKIQYQYDDYKLLIVKPLLVLINDFLLASKIRKKDILLCLLLSDNEGQRIASVLFDTLKQKSKTNLAEQLYLGLPLSLKTTLDLAVSKQEEEEEKLTKIDESDIPYEKRISLLNVDESVKVKAMEKLKSMKTNFQGDSKASTWLDGLLKVPFGIYRENPILTFKNSFISNVNNKYKSTLTSETDILNLLKSKNDLKMIEEWNNFKNDSKKYISSVREVLDKAVFGHNDAKLQIERVIGQWINGNVKGAVLGLQGPPGTGKTSLAVKGLANCLKDTDGTSRPFAFLPIGGSSNGSTLVGHNYTYVGSTWGRIVDILITSKCMNPIIFIDEVDKVSKTEHGKEIISILTHLTDSTQNHEFEDKYFSGIKFDLSKALIIFSFNDINLIDPILKDRITVIDTHPLTLPEKITISNNFVIPDILKEIGFAKNDIVFSNEIITYLIETYTFEAGVRKLKEKYYEIIREINLQKIYQNDVFALPYTVEKEFIENLFHKKPKMRVKTIHHESLPGLVNGLYATASGVGGLTVIQVIKHPSDKNLDISMTGKQGDVMKESINYAFKIAFGLLPYEKQKELIEQKDKFGLHVHTPEAATPKDGPSAGAAITLAFYSVLTNTKVNREVAMTGEIDLLQNVTAIGGLGAKLLGAKRAGAKKVLIPQENEEDLIRLRKDGISPEDDDFIVIPVSHFKQVLEHALL